MAMNHHPNNSAHPVSQPQPARLVTSDESDLLTLPHAAAKLAISRRSLERLIARGEFPPPLKLGRASRVHRSDLANYLEQLRRARGEKIGTS